MSEEEGDEAETDGQGYRLAAVESDRWCEHMQGLMQLGTVHDRGRLTWHAAASWD